MGTNQSMNVVYKQIINDAVTGVMQYIIQQIELQPINTNKLLSSTNNNSIFAQFRSTLTDFSSKKWLKW